jgi:hypothetical protein
LLLPVAEERNPQRLRHQVAPVVAHHGLARQVAALEPPDKASRAETPTPDLVVQAAAVPQQPDLTRLLWGRVPGLTQTLAAQPAVTASPQPSRVLLCTSAVAVAAADTLTASSAPHLEVKAGRVVLVAAGQVARVLFLDCLPVEQQVPRIPAVVVVPLAATAAQVR